MHEFSLPIFIIFGIELPSSTTWFYVKT